MKRRLLLCCLQLFWIALFLLVAFFYLRSYSKTDYWSWRIKRGYYAKSDHGELSVFAWGFIGFDGTNHYYLPVYYLNPNPDENAFDNKTTLPHWPIWTDVPVCPIDVEIHPNGYGISYSSYYHLPHDQIRLGLAYWVLLAAITLAFLASLAWRKIRNRRHSRARGFDLQPPPQNSSVTAPIPTPQNPAPS